MTDELTYTGSEASTCGQAPVIRTFCGTCGSPLSYVDARLEGQTYLMLGAMDSPENYTPTLHAYVHEKLPYLHFDDGLPCIEGASVPRPDGENQ